MLLYILMVLVMAACGYSGMHAEHGLDEAQDLLSVDPAEALERLNGYDVAEFDDSAVMARWALLYSEALAANRLVVPTDTIINIAIDFYGADKLSAEYLRACSLKDVLSEGSEENALASALYLQKEKEYRLYKERVSRNRIVFSAITIILITIAVIIWQRQRIKLKDARFDVLIAEAAALKDCLKTRSDEFSALERRLTDVLANRFGPIDELCQTYYEQQGTRTERKALVEKVKEQIESLKTDKGLFAEMEHCNCDLLRKFRDDFPQAKPDDYRMMVYLAGRLSNRTIALLVDESIETVYKRKSRLKAKIRASEAPSRDELLSIF